MGEKNNNNRVEVVTSESMADPRDGFEKTHFYFNKFENGSCYDKGDEDYIKVMDIPDDLVFYVNSY